MECKLLTILIQVRNRTGPDKWAGGNDHICGVVFAQAIRLTNYYLFKFVGIQYSGTGRVAFLPDTPEGREVAGLLRVCFDRRLTFTVGRSLTTGRTLPWLFPAFKHLSNLPIRSVAGYVSCLFLSNKLRIVINDSFMKTLIVGLDNSVVWNGVHHKTSPRGGTSHYGWPDSTYFVRVKEELKAKGITRVWSLSLSGFFD